MIAASTIPISTATRAITCGLPVRAREAWMGRSAKLLGRKSSAAITQATAETAAEM